MIFFSKNLKIIRKAKGLTQGGLAEIIGVKANTISNYENGSSAPDIIMLEKLVKVLDVDAQSLLYENLQTKTTEKAVNQNDGLYDGLNDGKPKLQKRPSNTDEYPDEPLVSIAMNAQGEYDPEEDADLIAQGIDPDSTDNLFGGWTNRMIYRWLSRKLEEHTLDLYNSGEAYPAEIVQQLLKQRDQGLVEKAVEQFRKEIQQNETRPK